MLKMYNLILASILIKQITIWLSIDIFFCENVKV